MDRLIAALILLVVIVVALVFARWYHRFSRRRYEQSLRVHRGFDEMRELDDLLLEIVALGAARRGATFTLTDLRNEWENIHGAT